MSPILMPAAFLGHGTPMNALEHNRHTAAWQAFGAAVPRPRAILVVSAHWEENAFSVTLSAPRKFADMETSERIEACYQHAVLQYRSSQTLTNTTLRERFKLHEKQRNTITNLISEAVTAGRIRRKDASSGNKFAQYIPYWA